MAISYYITSRAHWAGENPLGLLRARIRAAAEASVDFVQIREKDLPAAELLELVKAAGMACAGRSTRLLVNGRADVAVAGRADGLHLSPPALPLAALRRQWTSLHFVGVSCHNEEEVAEAIRAGVDYLLLGPVYETPSKPGAAPLGIERFAKICAQSPAPVYALGGVSRANAAECVQAGARGIAGIRLFQQETDLQALIAEIAKL